MIDAVRPLLTIFQVFVRVYVSHHFVVSNEIVSDAVFFALFQRSRRIYRKIKIKYSDKVKLVFFIFVNLRAIG